MISINTGLFPCPAFNECEQKLLGQTLKSLLGCCDELKGVFAKNERGYRLIAIKKRF